jgi:hypothetical protein
MVREQEQDTALTEEFQYEGQTRPAADTKSVEDNFPSCDLAVEEVMTGFKRRFHLKQNVPRKIKKCGIRTWEFHR